MKRLAFLLCFTICLISCDRNDDNLPSEVFEVTTWNKSMDCGLIVIVFKESDKENIERLTGWNSTIYEAFNLDTERFASPGQTLKVRVRKTLDSELFPCTRLGPTFPWVTILHAEIIE